MRNQTAVIGMDIAPKDHQMLKQSGTDFDIVAKLWNSLSTQRLEPHSIPGIKEDDDAILGIFWRSRSLHGKIPVDFGELRNLGWLRMDSNSLCGSIPSQIGLLMNLKELNLFRNQLTGEIPPEIGNLMNLQWLALNNNQLTGNIPKEFGNLKSLKYLNLSNNLLKGHVPIEVNNLGCLQFLDISNNHLLITYLDVSKIHSFNG